MATKSPSSCSLSLRAQELTRERLREIACDTDRRFAILAVVEWLALIAASVWMAPLFWVGSQQPHIWMAVLAGGVIISAPVFLTWKNSGHVLTRHVVAVAQMLMAGMLVHMAGGRVETHFAYFGLLSFLAFYRDWKVLITASAIAGLDHVLRAMLWPESMYGGASVEFWRPLEHISWVVFEVGFLIDFIVQNRRALYGTMQDHARLEGVSEEIAAQVEARTLELGESEQRYRIMFENSPLPMWLSDFEYGVFLAVNQQALRKYGYSEEEFLRMATSDLRPPEDVKAFNAFLQSLPRDDMARMREWRHVKKDGTIFDVEVSSHPVEWDGRKAVLILANDISERKRAERDRSEMEVQLRHAQKLESIGQLAAGIAHEINTPTQYIGDNLHFLNDAFRDLEKLLAVQEHLLPALPPEQAAQLRQAMEDAETTYLMDEIPKAVAQALDGIERVSTLVRAMKEFSHPGSKEKTPANLNHAIESTIIVARNEWKYVATLETDLDAELPLVPCLVSDLNQVVLNLIVNAAHAIGETVRKGAPDGILGKIVIRTRAFPEWAEIQVQDSGSGIPVEARSRIFDPFFTTKEVGKGTGQGLAIARSVIVDKHGGTIHFETELGKGTTFTIRLPWGEADLLALDDAGTLLPEPELVRG
jgi:PAS domain S-box-containing protein